MGEGAAELAAHLGFGSAELERPAPLAIDHDRALHAHGASYLDVVRALRGEFPHVPDVVEHPADEAGVLRALERAHGANFSVTPFGGGTSVVGGADPVRGPGHDGAMSLDLKRLDRVLEVDRISLAARIQAGATGPRIEEQLAEHGMTMRFYPQSFERSTLGGWIATRAAGHFATGPTHIDDLVESVRAVTARGDVWESRRLPGSGAGPSPDRLLLGSEGTLAVITEAWVRDPPARRAALERPRRARRLRDRARADPGDRPGRAAAVQLPPDRGARGAADVRRRRRRSCCSASKATSVASRPSGASARASPRAAAAAGGRRSCARPTCATRSSRWACSPRRTRPRSRGTGSRR